MHVLHLCDGDVRSNRFEDYLHACVRARMHAWLLAQLVNIWIPKPPQEQAPRDGVHKS